MPTRTRQPPPAPGPTDTVPAMLTPGEFVIKRDAVKRIGVDKLNRMNRGGGTGPGYQTGGYVPSKEAEAQALQTAGQYQGTRDVLTPESAPNVGLDPAKGYIDPNFPAPRVTTIPEAVGKWTTEHIGNLVRGFLNTPLLPSAGQVTNVPVPPQTQPSPSSQPSFTPPDTDKFVEPPSEAKTQEPSFTPPDKDKFVQGPETKAEQPKTEPSFTPPDTDKFVEPSAGATGAAEQQALQYAGKPQPGEAPPGHIELGPPSTQPSTTQQPSIRQQAGVTQIGGAPIGSLQSELNYVGAADAQNAKSDPAPPPAQKAEDQKPAQTDTSTTTTGDYSGIVNSQIASMPKGGKYATDSQAFQQLSNAITVDAQGNLHVDTSRVNRGFCSGASYLNFCATIAELQKEGKIKLDPETAKALLVTSQADGQGIWGRFNANGPGVARLFQETGMGQNFTDINQAKPGDYLKIFWNNNIGKDEHGHAVIYAGRAPNGDIKYWSANQNGGYSMAQVPANKVKGMLFSRLTHPENINNVTKIPETDPYLSSLLKRNSSADEMKKMTGVDQSTSSAATSTVPTEPGTTKGNTLSGTSTIFALNYNGSPDRQDNGIGFFTDPKTGKPYDTRKAIGVAVPVDVLEATFGKFTKRNPDGTYSALDTPEAKEIIKKIQSSHVEVPDEKGNIHKFGMVDIQGSLAGHPGKVLDFTYGAAKEMGFTDNHHVSYQIVSADGTPFAVPDLSKLPAYAGSGKGKGKGKSKEELQLLVPSEGGAPAMPQGPSMAAASGGVGGGAGGGQQAPENAGSLGFGLGGGGTGGMQGGGGGESTPQPQWTGTGGPAWGGQSVSDLGRVMTPSEVAALTGGTAPAQAQLPGGQGRLQQPAQNLPFEVLPPAAPGVGAQPQLPTAKPPIEIQAERLPSQGAAQLTPQARLQKELLGLTAPQKPVAAGAIDPTVVQGLMKRGFNRAQAEALAAKATVSKPGALPITGAASFRGPVPPPAPMQAPAGRPLPRVGGIQLEQPSGAPASTQGVPNPAGFHARLPGLLQQGDLKAAQAEHTKHLSGDDTRIRKQPDNLFKGEHFQAGDMLHAHLMGNVPEHERNMMSEAENAIRNKRPMHVTYISAPKKGLGEYGAPTRGSRRVEYEMSSPQARLLGAKEGEPAEGELAGHSFIPTAVGISLAKKEGHPHQAYVQGVSTNVLAGNHHHLNMALAKMGEHSPYPHLDEKFARDLEGYVHNLNAGYRGTGESPAPGTKDFPTHVDPHYTPHRLTRHEADFLNAAINNQEAQTKSGERAQALRELAKEAGTLVSKDGETNALRNRIDDYHTRLNPELFGHAGKEWSDRVLDATIRTFKAGLIHRTHERAEEMPEGIRPGEGHRPLTEAIHRTSPMGRPDTAVAANLATGGLVKQSPKIAALSDEEYNELAGNIRKQFLSGKLKTAEYLERMKDVPAPGVELHHFQQGGLVDDQDQGDGQPPGGPGILPEEEQAAQAPQGPPAAPGGAPPQMAAAPPRTAPAAPPQMPAAPPRTEPAVGPAPAPKQPPPAGKAPAPEKEPTYKEMSPAQKEAYVRGRVKDRLANQIKGAVKLRPVLEEDGSYKRDDAGNPQWEKNHYDLVNSHILGNKRLDRAKDQKFKDQEDIYDKKEHTHLNDIDRKRLSYLEQKSAVDTMADKIVDAYHKHMVNEPSVMAAKGWYTSMQQKLKKAFGSDAEIFAQLLGATSARTGVHQNFIQALDAYDQLKSGKFDKHIAKYLEAHEHLGKGEGALAKHMHESGIIQEMLDAGKLPKGVPKTDAAAMAAWIAHHDILPRQKNGQKFNANSNQVLKVLAQKWLQNVKAPKTPNFAGNLSGRTREATIDVWAARFLHELGNEGNKKPWLLQPGGESGVRGLDFSFSQRAMRKAADKLGLSPDDLQAISWYHQKHLWDQRGHTKGQGAKKASFDETFDRIFSPSGERLTDEEARKAFAGEKDEPVEEDEEEAA